MKKPEKKQIGINWPIGTQIPYGHEIYNESWDLWEPYCKQEVLKAKIEVYQCLLPDVFTNVKEIIRKRIKELTKQLNAGDWDDGKRIIKKNNYIWKQC